jgi:Ca2+-binding EF-hand superfamily protein
LLLAFYGTQPIKSDDFVDVVNGCSLYKEDVTGLFHELDHDKNGEVSQEDVISSIAAEHSKPHHDEFVETILANEQAINEYKKKKAQSDRHSILIVLFLS